MHIGDITAADIVRAQLKDKAFERFVHQLLDAEAELRHRATATPRGPVAPYRRDDKRDLVFDVRDPPRQPRDSFTSPLTWDELARRAREEGIDSVTAYASPRRVAYTAAVEAPQAAAWAVSEVIARLDEQGLMSASKARSVLREVLAHVIHRAIPADAFLAVEAALFRLAQVDDEPWANNATGVWKSLFLPALHHTHQPWTLRLGRLDERLADEDVQRRVLAIDALGAAVGASEEPLGHVDDDLRDGQWPAPTANELAEMKDQLWSRLLDACSDPVEEASDRARRVVIGHLRSALGRRLHAPQLHRIATLAASWTVDQRRVFIEKVADVRRYDADRLAGLPVELHDGLAALEAALAPTSLRERVVVQVGTWTPGPWRIDDQERPAHEQVIDRSLARELLEAPEDQDGVLSWLLGPQASRHRNFWRALGFVDEEREILRKLLTLVHEGAKPQALTDYLLGWADDEGPEATEAWLEQHADDETLTPALVGFLVMQAPSSDRLARLTAFVSRGSSADGIGSVAYGDWAKALGIDEMSGLVRSLVAREDLASVAAPIIVQLLDRDPTEPIRRELVTLLGRVLHTHLERRVVIAAQDWFERGVLALAREGCFETVVAIVMRALAVADDPSNVGLGHTLTTKLLHEGFAEHLWPHLTAAMLEEPHSLLVLQLAQEGLLRHLAPELVLAWVGTDHRRARIVADLCNPHGARLDEVTRQLLVQFGSQRAVADALAARAWSSPGLVPGGSSTFERQQREHASRWATDPHPQVRQWAQRLEASLRSRIDEDDVRRELRHELG